MKVSFDFEVNSINNNTNTIAMLVMVDEDWKEKANVVIEKLSKDYGNTEK